jgi:hypothetical protein
VVEDGVGVSRRVPWDAYADGRVWELERGLDYDQDDEHARRAAKAWAYRRGAEFRTSVPSPGRLRVQFVDHLGTQGLRGTA